MKDGRLDSGKRLGYGCMVFFVLILLCCYQEYQYYLQQNTENMLLYGILIALSVLMLVKAAVGVGHPSNRQGESKKKRRGEV